MFSLSSTTYIMICFTQVFQDGVEAVMASSKKINPFYVPFVTTNIGSALLAMDLVSLMIVWLEIWDGQQHIVVAI